MGRLLLGNVSFTHLFVCVRCGGRLLVGNICRLLKVTRNRFHFLRAEFSAFSRRWGVPFLWKTHNVLCGCQLNLHPFRLMCYAGGCIGMPRFKVPLQRRRINLQVNIFPPQVRGCRSIFSTCYPNMAAVCFRPVCMCVLQERSDRNTAAATKIMVCRLMRWR